MRMLPISANRYMWNIFSEKWGPIQCYFFRRHISWSYAIFKGFNASAKRFDLCQPAQSAQADICRNGLLFLNFLDGKGRFHIVIYLVARQNGFYGSMDQSLNTRTRHRVDTLGVLCS